MRFSIRFLLLVILYAALAVWVVDQNVDHLRLSGYSPKSNSSTGVKIEFVRPLSNMYLFIDDEELCKIPSARGVVVQVEFSRRSIDGGGRIITISVVASQNGRKIFKGANRNRLYINCGNFDL